MPDSPARAKIGPMRTFQLFLTAAAAMLLSGAATPTTLQDDVASTEVEELAQFQETVANMRAALLRPGERVEGWDRGGANPDADLRALGAERFYFLSRSDEEDSVTILTDRPIADFAPARWQIVDTYGAPSGAGGRGQVDFVPLSARYVFAARARGERRGDVDCYGDLDHALLYEIPDARPSPDDEIVPILFRVMILALEGETICTRSDGNRTQGYRSRTFLPDGRTLPEMDRGRETEVMTIVPAAPIDRLIAWRGPPPEGRPTT